MKSPGKVAPIRSRRFERVDLPPTSGVYVTGPRGKLFGRLRQIGRGGCLLETAAPLPVGSRQVLLIVDQGRNIRCRVTAVVRYSGPEITGLKFLELDGIAAVQIGSLIDCYHEQPAVPKRVLRAPRTSRLGTA